MENRTENKAPTQNIQDLYLNTVRREKLAVTVFLISGVKLIGKIKGFDKYSVILEANKPQTVVTVPQQAVALDQTGPYLFVVDDKNVVHLRRIKAGIVRNGKLVVTDGLKDGEKVVIQGQQRIRDGMTVAPTLAPPTPGQAKQ